MFLFSPLCNWLMAAASAAAEDILLVTHVSQVARLMLELKMFMNQFSISRSDWRLSRSECFNGIELNGWADYYRYSECLALTNLIIIPNLISKCMKVALGNQGNLKSNFTSNRMCIVQTCLECCWQCHSSAFYQLISGASFMPWQRQSIECSSFKWTMECELPWNLLSDKCCYEIQRIYMSEFRPKSVK